MATEKKEQKVEDDRAQFERLKKKYEKVEHEGSESH
jgi:hypothetical protein